MPVMMKDIDNLLKDEKYYKEEEVIFAPGQMFQLIKTELINEIFELTFVNTWYINPDQVLYKPFNSIINMIVNYLAIIFYIIL